MDGYQRQGVKLEDMNDAQKAAAFALMEAALSAKGFQLSRDITSSITASTARSS